MHKPYDFGSNAGARLAPRLSAFFQGRPSKTPSRALSVSGQMARFTVFSKEKPGPNPTGLPVLCGNLEIRQQAAVQFQPVSLVQTGR